MAFTLESAQSIWFGNSVYMDIAWCFFLDPEKYLVWKKPKLSSFS
jgi:hypothetical protein